MQRSDARKREATPSEDGTLTEAEQKALAAHVPGANRAKEPYGWDASTKALCATVARIKAEAVQAERERIAGRIQSRAVPLLPDNTLEQRLVGDAYRNAARIARGEGR